MENGIYIAATYLKVLGNDKQLLTILNTEFGEQQTKQILSNEFIYENDTNTVFQAFAKTGLDSWILKYGAQISVASHGPLGFAVLSAPDLHSALRVLADYSVIRSSAYSAQMAHHDNRVEYIITDKMGGSLAGRWLLESAISVAQRLIETMMALPLGDNAVIRFAHSKPSYHKKLQTFYGVQCEYDADDHAISIPASWCRIPSPLSDPSTFQTNLQKCAELKLALQGSQDITESTRLILRGYFNQRASGETTAAQLPSLRSLAAQHNMTIRTFARKLEPNNTSYKQLLEESRREQACELLHTTHLTIADIAYMLAYQEPANFIRAFKSSFHTTPTEWRRAKP